MIKNIYRNPVVNNIRNGEKLEAFSLRSGTTQGCPLTPLLFDFVLEVLPIVIRQKEIKVTQMERKERCDSSVIISWIGNKEKGEK